MELDFDRLVKILRDPPPVPYPVILPDFFLDHFVITGSFEDFMADLRKLAEQGGGNLIGTSQIISRGGNSVNTASALQALGANPKLIVKTDKKGASILEVLVSPELDLGLVKDNGALSSTVSIETEYEGRRVNLMVSDSGSAAEFSFEDLSENDLSAIRDCGLVALLCLNHNRNAVALAENLFGFARDSAKSLTFMDIGDPSGNPDIIEPLTRKVLCEGLVDILGVNENEVGWFAQALSDRNDRWKQTFKESGLWLPAAELISMETGVRVDLHTPSYAATIEDGECTKIPAFSVDANIVCGAGDAWNAGTIYGTLLNLMPSDRLVLANAVAALYISSSEGDHPTPQDVISFICSQSVR
ncbi:MAG: carbohydrate kinase family protein [Candidatus Thorarchaeota archaeon]|nr:MAG: carbohydrate kinase family protein [Candidatus Thorarchaeota archaeon]